MASVLMLAVAGQNQVPYERLLLDPNSINGVPWYTGLVSNLGVLGWSAGTAMAAFGAWIARVGSRESAVSMLRGGAALSAILLLDDLFQIHVLVDPVFGVSKPVVYSIYLGLTGWWVATERQEIHRTRSELLLAAGAAFVGSVGFDQFGTVIGLPSSAALLLEDAAKFLGVLAWAQYFMVTSADIVRSIVVESKPTEVADHPVDGRRRPDASSTSGPTGPVRGPVPVPSGRPRSR